MTQQKLEKKPISFSNILLGAGLNLAEVTTLGQPLEVIKTTMAANRSLSLLQSAKLVWSRGGLFGFYQGLIPWAWIEASTKGAVLLFVSAEAEYQFKKVGASNFVSGIGGGIVGGVAQAYLTMGFCTCMKTVEITRSKQAAVEGAVQQTSLQVFKDIYKKEGIKGINKGVNAVAIRQMTNWGPVSDSPDWLRTSSRRPPARRKTTSSARSKRSLPAPLVVVSLHGTNLLRWFVSRCSQRPTIQTDQRTSALSVRPSTSTSITD